MSTFDYAATAATAQRLLDKFGKEIEFIENPDDALDNSMPWNGQDVSGDIPHVLKAVSVPPNTVRQFGITGLSEGTEFKDATQFSEQVWIVYPGSTIIKNLTAAIIDGVRYAVIVTQELKPADTTVLGFIVVRR